jgi:hypothetical protein
MNFTLTNESLYKDIKEWFEQNKDELPETLDAETMYFGSPKHQVEMWIYQIDYALHKHGKPNETAKVAKDGLKKMYRALQNKSNWNVKMKIIGE